MNNYSMTTAASSTSSQVLQYSWVMLVVFLVSLFAVSFPALSKRTSYIAIPRIVFFVGKHFGTGVILSTAFVHLLQDAFVQLNDRAVRKISRVGDWAGLIVLGSLLIIFCIEYASTAYVSRLDPEASSDNHEHDPSHTHNVDVEAASPNDCSRTSQHKHNADERTPLISSHTPSHLYNHNPYESRIAHAFHHRFSHKLSGCFSHTEVADTQNKTSQLDPTSSTLTLSVDTVEAEGEEVEEELQEEEQKNITASSRRQVVGILVLQMGIMLHSLVIGLTLSITSGTEFTSLVTAITFHQLFEGISLGTRIATLPATSRSLQRTLSLAFAITVPCGIIIGLCTLRGTHEDVKMKLIQGLMAAISAGMLIYAACVEMLAGDFIMDPTLWKSGVGKQALAVGSLIVGAGAMAVVGLWS